MQNWVCSTYGILLHMWPHRCLQFIEKGDDDIFIWNLLSRFWIDLSKLVHCSATSYRHLFFIIKVSLKCYMERIDPISFWISYVIMNILLMLIRVSLACIVYLLIQSYNRDLFLFLYFLLIIVSAITSFTIHNDKSAINGKSIMYLNRHQTEEWKGWMQVCHFIFYGSGLPFGLVHVC